jgi:integrase
MLGSRALTKNEVKLISALISTKQNGVRDLMLFRFLCLTGCRVSEPLQLRVSDVLNTQDGTIQKSVLLTKTKNGSNHRVHLTSSLRAFLVDYISDMDLSAADFLFPSQKKTGKAVHPNSATRMLNGIMKETGASDITSHSCRKFFGVSARRLGADLQTISQCLNHSNISITSRYFRAEEWEMEKVMEQIRI